ncbi:molybdate ABC transporter permease subunit [Maridesulfovibrio bastinii]|uniref:molybdate ABC transporter permease subunit n=1 Tax=Maridesulfovibrio bastinii TaxID=47157 RepID=UPI0004298609|nr:molybdate ABC transporter permease subunit [Maridesulfovibrio bastinii]
MDTASLWVTARLALCVTPLLLCAALPLAYFIVFSRVKGKKIIEATCNLPLVLPPTVLGFYLLVAMGPNSPLGEGWETFTGSRLIFSFSGLVIGSMVYSLPFAIQPLKTSFAKLDTRLIESAYILGLSPIKTFFRVILPNSLGGVASAGVLIFAHTVGEFGVALMIGGSVPGQTRVASISIFEHVEMLDYAGAASLSIVLLIFSYIVLLIMGSIK